jgi:hypothetical protein
VGGVILLGRLYLFVLRIFEATILTGFLIEGNSWTQEAVLAFIDTCDAMIDTALRANFLELFVESGMFSILIGIAHTMSFVVRDAVAMIVISNFHAFDDSIVAFFVKFFWKPLSGFLDDIEWTDDCFAPVLADWTGFAQKSVSKVTLLKFGKCEIFFRPGWRSIAKLSDINELYITFIAILATLDEPNKCILLRLFQVSFQYTTQKPFLLVLMASPFRPSLHPVRLLNSN